MPSLGQIMACDLSAPSHYLNQCWLIESSQPLGMNESQWKLDWNMTIFIQENEFEHVICKMGSILSQPYCVKYSYQDPRIWRAYTGIIHPYVSLSVGPSTTPKIFLGEIFNFDISYALALGMLKFIPHMSFYDDDKVYPSHELLWWGGGGGGGGWLMTMMMHYELLETKSGFVQMTKFCFWQTFEIMTMDGWLREH